jgi:hypothetical protein
MSRDALMTRSRRSWCSSSSFRKPSNIGMNGEADWACDSSPMASSRDRFLLMERSVSTKIDMRRKKLGSASLRPMTSLIGRGLHRCFNWPFLFCASTVSASLRCEYEIHVGPSPLPQKTSLSSSFSHVQSQLLLFFLRSPFLFSFFTRNLANFF